MLICSDSPKKKRITSPKRDTLSRLAAARCNLERFTFTTTGFASSGWITLDLYMKRPRQVVPKPIPFSTSTATHESMKNLLSRSKGIFFFLFLLFTLSPLSYFFVTKNIVFYAVVDGTSMEPSFHNGDKVLVWKLPLFFHHITNGDVVVLREYKGMNRGDGNIDIKRVSGTPGDVVQDHRYRGLNFIGLTGDEYYVLGDNAKVSYDSRFYGPIHKQQILGVVLK